MVWNYRVCLAVAVVWAGLPSAPPPEPVTAEAAAILDRYVEASGGQAAHARIRNRVAKIRLEIAGQGIVIDGTLTLARPNRNYTVIQSDVTGKIERGSDGDGEVEGKACRKVELTPHGLKPQVLCFDEESGLLAGVEMKTTTPMGEIPVVGTVGGYREVDGVKPPFVLKTKLPGQERVTTVERIAYNQDVPDSRFAAPAALAGGK